ncbi:TPA: hypothetical protein N0F65_010457 [Lagenidium giganteum]|uniref:DUF4219 domain-containing protein n=1 Tax=Lagenidium giganteum TaxID=4803 RepID=A0AAV2YIA1_9STRA|nr:TPA: hypothetical protein N0F65_010457 [Lagenidium giganteum]
MSFNASNYTSWKMRVQSRLEAKGLWRIVTLRERPPHRAPRHIEDEFWQRESQAKAFLLETLDIVISVGMKQYAYEILEYLAQTYESKNWRNLIALREQFISLKYVDGEEMTPHLNRLKLLADKLGRQNRHIDDQEQVCQLLTSLPASWNQF